ncbi:MAG: cysteine desulfurase [Phycisphaerales bacterium]|nr:cysteine desulfurase [Phycisphaerales bacterium]
MTVYLDNAASTPIHPAAIEAMMPWLQGEGANAASVQHQPGRRAAKAVGEAREQVASLLGRQAGEIVFTASATEACNLAIKGSMRPRLRSGDVIHLVAPMHEHPAVLDPLRRLEREGAQLTLVQPPSSGVMTAAEIEPHLRDDTALVACMHANNEIGTVNDLATISPLCRDRGVLLVVDAAQSAGRVNVSSIEADLLIASSHKMHGPSGAAALAITGGAAGAGLAPLIEGGGHEFGLRSGSLNVPAIVGFAAACQWAETHMVDEGRRLEKLRDQLEHALLDMFPGSQVNGDGAARLPGITNCSLAIGRPEPVPQLLPDVACSTGAACSSAQPGPSHVLAAMGLSEAAASAAVRLSLGAHTTAACVERAIKAFEAISR